MAVGDVNGQYVVFDDDSSVCFHSDVCRTFELAAFLRRPAAAESISPCYTAGLYVVNCEHRISRPTLSGSVPRGRPIFKIGRFAVVLRSPLPRRFSDRPYRMRRRNTARYCSIRNAHRVQNIVTSYFDGRPETCPSSEQPQITMRFANVHDVLDVTAGGRSTDKRD